MAKQPSFLESSEGQEMRQTRNSFCENENEKEFNVKRSMDKGHKKTLIFNSNQKFN